jgi:NAD(P)H-dependent flavin oxidoreductase YrpB (nitropropane dioxygenase family)
MVTGPLLDLNVTNPVLAAPMAGGPSTPELVDAASSAGSFGFLAAGYKTPEALAEQMRSLRDRQIPFGVNVFVPNRLPVDPGEFSRYAQLIRPEAELYGLDVSARSPVEDDDHWQSKIDLLLAEPVPLVGFTFAIPDKRVLDALHRAGTTLVQTVTSVEEARAAVGAGMDILAVQSFEAGGHWGTFTPEQPPPLVRVAELVRRVGAAVDAPLFAAGGIATAEQVAAVSRAGAVAVLVGTALLRTDESGASPPYKAALADRQGLETVATKAFTGRPARTVPNLFTDRYDALAPSGYPAIHHLTSPIRRAAAGAGDADRINLWAGTGYNQGQAETATKTLTRLAVGV